VGPEVPQVRTIAVIGSGPAGQEMAREAALAGYRTILEDILPATLRRAQEALREQLKEGRAAGAVSPQDADGAFARISYASTVEDAARQADLVIESVPDELESKLEIFALLDRMCRPGTILASTTVSFGISDITDITFRRGNCVGLRFVSTNPTERRLEVVRGVETDDVTWIAAVEVARRMRKDALLLDERAG
jgi:3-hydroxybutyryl-CoA dehydrogenase